MSAVSLGDGREPGHPLRWAAVALVVAGVHAGAGWWLAGRSFAPPPPPDGVAGVTVDLEPLLAPVAQPDMAQPLSTAGSAPTPQVAEAPDTQPAEPPPPADTPPPAPEPPPAEAAAAPPPPEPVPAVQPPVPVPAPVPEIVPPPAAAPSDAVLAPPPLPPRPVSTRPRTVAVKPPPPKPVPPKPDPRRMAQEEARREAREAAEVEARQQRRAARAEARAARAAAVREGGGQATESAAPAPATSGAAVSTWRGEVMAHLRSYTPASPNGASGNVRVAFTVDRGGRVTSASVSGSSGDAELDQAAVSMVRRASPVPPPPPELGGRISLGVPVHFR